MVLVYILATPFMMLATMIMLLTDIKHPLKASKACYEGLKLGHRSAMLWVKYGRKDCLNHIEEL
jgi:hypothetical protein